MIARRDSERAAAREPPVVCHLVERLTVGGAQAALANVATGVRGASYRVLVCCFEGGPLAVELEKEGIPVTCLELPRRSIATGPLWIVYVLRLLIAVVTFMRRQRVSIIHAHLPDAIIVGATAALFCRARVVGTYQGLGILPRGRGRYDPRNLFRRALYRVTGLLSDRTIAVSEPVLRLLCDDLGFSPRKTVLVPNGIDTSRIAGGRKSDRVRREIGIDPGARVITCVGRFVPNKGQHVLIEAMSVVLRRHSNAVLVLLGDGPTRQQLQARTRELRLEAGVLFAGTRTDVPEVLALTEIFALPSFYEGIPLSVLEAMAAAKPVVATRVPGNIDVIEDERYGILVQPNDPGDMARAICALLDEPERGRSMGDRARERVVQEFDVKHSIARIGELYQEVLSGRSSADRKRRST